MLTLDEMIRLGIVPPDILAAIEKERAEWREYCNALEQGLAGHTPPA